jgi:hypothetical protein
MKRVEVLREQAGVLRTLAASFDMPQIKQDLLNLAERCEHMAEQIAREISSRLAQPMSGRPPSGDGISGS